MPAVRKIEWVGIALALLAVQSGCSAPVDEPTGRTAAPIIGGEPDAADPAVVLLVSYPADQSVLSLCTATLVAPDVLLTAAHCVTPLTHAGETFGVFVGPDANGYPTAASLIPELHPVAEVHAHPDYDPAPPFYADIGVAILKSPLATPPVPLRTTALPSDIAGMSTRIVGYGQTTYGQLNAQKNSAKTVIAAVDSGDTLTVGDSVRRSCVGDSGGPALVVLDGVESVVGVDSYSDLVGCIEPAHYRRTDVHAAFLNAYVQSSGGAGGGGAAGAAGSGSGAGSGGAAGGSGGAQGGSAGADGGTAGAAAGGAAPGSSGSSDGGCALAARPAPGGASWLIALALTASWRRRRSSARA